MPAAALGEPGDLLILLLKFFLFKNLFPPSLGILFHIPIFLSLVSGMVSISLPVHKTTKKNSVDKKSGVALNPLSQMIAYTLYFLQAKIAMNE